MKEDLNNRLLTRVSFMFKLTEVRDPSTGKIRITVSAPIIYSDRPQYVEQSSAGRLYFSTKPTSAAPLGTVRYLDPAAPRRTSGSSSPSRPRGSDPNSFLVANIDNVVGRSRLGDEHRERRAHALRSPVRSAPRPRRA